MVARTKPVPRGRGFKPGDIVKDPFSEQVGIIIDGRGSRRLHGRAADYVLVKFEDTAPDTLSVVHPSILLMVQRRPYGGF